MNVVVMCLLGAGIGAGALITWRALAPRPTPIGLVLADLARPGTPIGTEAPAADPTIDRIGSISRRIIGAVGQDTSTGLRSELELVERTPERHAFDKLLGAVAGLLVPNLAAVALTLAGMTMPVVVIGVLSLATAAPGFILPDFLLRAEAERRRRAGLHCLPSSLARGSSLCPDPAPRHALAASACSRACAIPITPPTVAATASAPATIPAFLRA